MPSTPTQCAAPSQSGSAWTPITFVMQGLLPELTTLQCQASPQCHSQAWQSSVGLTMPTWTWSSRRRCWKSWGSVVRVTGPTSASTGTPPQPPDPSTLQCHSHRLCSWHLPWLKHSGSSIYPALAPGERWVWADQPLCPCCGHFSKLFLRPGISPDTLGGPSQAGLQTQCPFLLGEASSKAMQESIPCLCLLPCLASMVFTQFSASAENKAWVSLSV